MGNTLHGTTSVPLTECNQPCDGDQGELCGAANRIFIYQDLSWSLPTDSDILNGLVTYNTTLDEIAAAVNQYKIDVAVLEQLLAQAQSQNSTAKRQSTTTISQAANNVVRDLIEMEDFVGNLRLSTNL